MSNPNLFDGVCVPGEGGTTSLSVMGNGPPVIVVHGGPGLEHSYFLPWLQPLAKNRTLVFYDQFDTIRDADQSSAKVSADQLVTQLVDILSFVGAGREVGMFAHSFGTHVALGALARQSRASVREVVLCNPFALDSERFAASGERLMNRIPSEVKLLIEQLEAEGTETAGTKLMYEALPYYVASPKNVPQMNFRSYSMSVNTTVFESIGSFNMTNAVAHLPLRTLLVYGENDFLLPSDSAECREKAFKEIVIPNAGHFPFAEQPKLFTNVLQEFFASSS